MSDPVAIALITGVTTSVSTIATLIVTLFTRRAVKKVDRTVQDQHRETRLSLAAACRHPADMPSASSYPDSKR